MVRREIRHYKFSYFLLCKMGVLNEKRCKNIYSYTIEFCKNKMSTTTSIVFGTLGLVGLGAASYYLYQTANSGMQDEDDAELERSRRDMLIYRDGEQVENYKSDNNLLIGGKTKKSRSKRKNTKSYKKMKNGKKRK